MGVVQMNSNPLAKDFNTGSLLKFAFPTISMMLFMGLYTIVDTIFVSRFVNTNALSAINIVCPVINLIVQEKTCHQFDCAIKTVIRHRAIDFYRAIRRSEKKEMPFAEIMDDLLNSIGTEDTYSTDYVAVFEVCGEKVSIEDEQLARALKAIEERKRNIVLQYFFIGDTDTYIGKMLDCSRANVTKCRIQALDKLKQLIEEEKEKCQKS